MVSSSLLAGKCNRSDAVHPVHVTEVDPEVQYWSCKTCGFVWATRGGKHLSAIAAERSSISLMMRMRHPRGSADAVTAA
jgi:transposase-like protein